MRAVSRTSSHRPGFFGRLCMPAVLLMVCLVPLSASAGAGLSGPEVEAREAAAVQDNVPDTPARPAGALTTAFLALFGFVGLGITVQLTAKRFDKDGVPTTQGFSIDSESDSFAVDLSAYSEAKVEEGAAPVRLQLSAAEEDRDSFRAIAVDEILRVEQLSHTGDDAFDLEGEREYYESLPAKKLALHFKKAREKGLSIKPQTSGEEPADKTGADGYGHVTVA